MSDRKDAEPLALASAIYGMRRELQQQPGLSPDTAGNHSVRQPNGPRPPTTGHVLQPAPHHDQTHGLAGSASFADVDRTNRLPAQTPEKVDAKQRVLAALMENDTRDGPGDRNVTANRNQGINAPGHGRGKMAAGANPFLTGGQAAVLQALSDRQKTQVR